MSKALARKPAVTALEQIAGMSKEDLDMLDYTVLPTIVNDGEMLKVRGQPWRLDGSFEAIILSATQYEYHKCSRTDHPIPGFYTYDKELTSRGDPVAEIHKTWEEDGCTWTVSNYIQAKVVMFSPEDYRNNLALVTISPTSVKRFVAYLKLDLQRRRLEPWQVITRFYLKEQAVRGKGGKMFHPWEFAAVSIIGDEERKLLAA